MTNETKILTILETLAEDVGGVKQDICGLKQDFGVLKEDVSGLKQDVSSLNQRMDRMELRMDGQEQQMDGLLLGQKRIEQDVKTIKQIVIDIENEQIPRINILFDAFQANKESNTHSHQ